MHAAKVKEANILQYFYKRKLSFLEPVKPVILSLCSAHLAAKMWQHSCE